MRAPAEAEPRRRGLALSHCSSLGGARRADRARHLAARAQAMEGSADRRARPQACPRRLQTCRRANAGRSSMRQRTNSAASRFRRNFSSARKRWSIRAARRCARTRPAPATGCSRRRASPAAASWWSIAASCRRAAGPEDAPHGRRPASSKSSARCAGRSSAARSRRTMSPRRTSGSRAILPRWRRRKAGAMSRRSTSIRRRRPRRAACPRSVRSSPACRTTTCNTR